MRLPCPSCPRHAPVRRLAGLAALAAILAAAPVSAQIVADPEAPFAALGDRLRHGDRVDVTGPDPGPLRGRVVAVGSDQLIVRTDKGLRTIAATDVDRIRRTRRGVVLGTLIGLGVGVAFAIPLNMLIAGEGGDAVGDTAKLLALTTGIGLGVDAAIDLPRTVYRRGNHPRVRLAPQVGPRGGGLALHVAF